MTWTVRATIYTISAVRDSHRWSAGKHHHHYRYTARPFPGWKVTFYYFPYYLKQTSSNWVPLSPLWCLQSKISCPLAIVPLPRKTVTTNQTRPTITTLSNSINYRRIRISQITEQWGVQRTFKPLRTITWPSSSEQQTVHLTFTTKSDFNDGGLSWLPGYIGNCSIPLTARIQPCSKFEIGSYVSYFSFKIRTHEAPVFGLRTLFCSLPHGHHPLSNTLHDHTAGLWWILRIRGYSSRCRNRCSRSSYQNEANNSE